MINVFIGYDTKEKVAHSVLTHSILKHSTKPVAITPIYLENIKDDFIRERNALSSTEFSFSRFITPHLMNYQGWALFMDCDMLMFEDIYTNLNLVKEDEWHDSYLFDVVRKKYLKNVPQFNLSPTIRRVGNPWPDTPMAEYMDHLKGKARKDAGEMLP